MKKEMRKLLKRYLKKRRRVTEGFIVMFLITGSLGYARPMEISDPDVTKTIETDEHYSKVVISGNNAVLNINGSVAAMAKGSGSGVTMEGNGISVTEDIKVSVNNKGIISGNIPLEAALTRGEFSGNGIFTFNTYNNAADISNSGFLTGDVRFTGDKFYTLKHSGNGVFGTANPAVVIQNSGVLLGKVAVYAKEFNSVYNNFGYSGNGVYSNGGGDNTIEENNGIISGDLHLTGGNDTGMISVKYSGNGIYDYGWGDFTIGENSGIISGETRLSGTVSSRSGEYSGTGIFNRSGSVIVDDNRGTISGNLLVNFDNTNPSGENIRPVASGIGIFGYHGADITNSGLVRGNTSMYDANGDYFATTDADSGIGISVSYDFRGRDVQIENSGVVMGSQSAIKARAANATSTVNNYGVLVGVGVNPQTQAQGIKENIGSAQYNDLGIEVILLGALSGHSSSLKSVADSTGTVEQIIYGTGGRSADGRSIVNAGAQGTTDSYKELTADTDYKDHIINGAGVAKGTLAIDNIDLNLTNSIINGYKTAVSLENGGSLVATDTVFNGGGLQGNDAVIKGVSGDNIISLLGSSVLNGDVNLGDGADIMSIATAAQINGDIYGGNGTDRLNLGDSGGSLKTLRTTADNLNIYHKISGFEDISVKGGVTLYETARIEGAEKINIEANSSLNLRIDPTKKDGNDRITGHPLYGSGAVITGAENTYEGIEGDTDGGALNIVTNGLGTGGIISMDTVTLDKNLYVRTNSIITQADLLDDGDVQVNVGQDLDEVASEVPINIDRYEKLNLVYKSIVTSGNKNIDALYPTANTSDKTESQAKEGLLLLLNEVFMANPYGYVSRTSKDSMGLFNEMVLNNPFRANEGNWMVYGGLTFGGDDYDSSYKNHIKGNYYGFDIYGVDINADSSTYGGYALAEYGVNKNTSVGFILGGANSNTDISNGSEIDGDSIYVGGYAKSEINNFKLTAGLGYQYSNYDTTRVAGNKYQSNKYEEDMRADGFSAYTGLSYDYALNNKWSLEPKLNLAYSRIIQDSVSEEGILSIEADKGSFNYVDTEIGMDLVRKISLDSGEGKFRLGLSYLYALKGSDDDYVTGRFQGGSDFDILVPERDRGIAKIKGSYDVEYKSGIVYSAGGAYLPGKNRDEYYVSIGAGFKFNSLKDFIPAKQVQPEKNTKVEKTRELLLIAEKPVVINKTESGFKLNRSELTEEMKGELNEVGKILSDKSLDGNVKITGHTDNTGPVKFNEKLSLERAKSARAVIENISKNENLTYTIEGKGSREPIATNETKAGRAKNRRVEVRYEKSKEK